MLVNVRLQGPDVIMAIIANGVKTALLQTGIYRCGHWNFETQFRQGGIHARCDMKMDYPTFPSKEDFGCTGVCDSPAQLLEVLPEEVTKGPDRFCISMVLIRRADQPSDGGWRWHKWGEYVGKQKPQYEYLHDEKDIDEVWTYHIYKVNETEMEPAESRRLGLQACRVRARGQIRSREDKMIRCLDGVMIGLQLYHLAESEMGIRCNSYNARMEEYDKRDSPRIRTPRRCGGEFIVPRSWAGRVIKCPVCKGPVTVEEAVLR